MRHRLPNRPALATAVLLAGLILLAPEAWAETGEDRAQRSVTLSMGYGADAASPSAGGLVLVPPGLPGWYAVQFRPDRHSAIELGYLFSKGPMEPMSTAEADRYPNLHYLSLGYARAFALDRFSTVHAGASLRAAPIMLTRHDGDEPRDEIAAGKFDLLLYGEFEWGLGFPHLFARAQYGPTLIVGPEEDRELFVNTLRNGATLSVLLGVRLHLPARR